MCMRHLTCTSYRFKTLTEAFLSCLEAADAPANTFTFSFPQKQKAETPGMSLAPSSSVPALPPAQAAMEARSKVAAAGGAAGGSWWRGASTTALPDGLVRQADALAAAGAWWRGAGNSWAHTHTHTHTHTADYVLVYGGGRVWDVRGGWALSVWGQRYIYAPLVHMFE